MTDLINSLSTLEMISINSWALKFLSKTKAKSLSDFWKSEYLYWVFWSFNGFFGCFKLSKNISNPTNASTLMSNFFNILGWISPKKATTFSLPLFKNILPDFPGW